MGAQKVTTTRLIDDLGRIVIPADIREAFGWGAGKKLEVAISDVASKSIIIRDFIFRCSLCQEKHKDLVRIENGYICPSCTAKIRTCVQ